MGPHEYLKGIVANELNQTFIIFNKNLRKCLSYASNPPSKALQAPPFGGGCVIPITVPNTGWLLYGGPVITKTKEPFLIDSGLFKYRVLLDTVLRKTMQNLKAVT